MKQKIIITGGTGFLGKRLVSIFSRNNLVYNLGRSINEECLNIKWDLKERLDNKQMPDDIDTLIHCASIVGESNEDKRTYLEINVLSTIELLDFCVRTGVKQFVYISTGGVYGFGEAPFYEDDNCNPSGIYNNSKFFSEKICMEYRDKLLITIVRPFFPYGKGQKDRLFDNILSNLRKNKTINLNYDGKPLINPIYIEDLTFIIRDIVVNRLEGIYNASGDEIVSIKDICEMLGNKFGIEDFSYYCNDNKISNMIGNNNKIKNDLNNPIKTSIFEGIDYLF